MNVTDTASIWTNYYTGPNGITMTIVFGVVIGLWIGAFLLHCFLKRKYAVLKDYSDLNDDSNN